MYGYNNPYTIPISNRKTNFAINDTLHYNFAVQSPPRYLSLPTFTRTKLCLILTSVLYRVCDRNNVYSYSKFCKPVKSFCFFLQLLKQEQVSIPFALYSSGTTSTIMFSLVICPLLFSNQGFVRLSIFHLKNHRNCIKHHGCV